VGQLLVPELCRLSLGVGWPVPSGGRQSRRDRAQCSLYFDLPSLAGKKWWLQDLLSDARYLEDGSQLLSSGLYLDMPGYGYHVFEVLPGPPSGATVG